MKMVNEILAKNLGRYPDFGYYKLHISKIESNIATNPDIAIETCKSLIEGVSKSILNRIDNTFDEKAETTGRNAKSVQQLFKRALEKIAELNEKFEPGFVHSSGHIVNVTSNIRTERGDISHGKSVPKETCSTPEFSAFVAKMTDLIISYVLEHFFEIDLGYREKLEFDSDEMQAYNRWLDDSVNFPIAKARYSKILFEQDYDEYESRYTDEYLKSLENDEEKAELQEVEPSDETPPLNIELPKELTESDKEPESEEIRNAHIERKRRHKEIVYEMYFGSKEIKPIVVEELINTFDESQFWTEQRTAIAASFAEAENINQDGLKAIISNYLFTQKRPFRDDVVAIMNEKPTLKDRAKLAEELTGKIIVFAKDLTQLSD
jgi:hypothetical protein